MRARTQAMVSGARRPGAEPLSFCSGSVTAAHHPNPTPNPGRSTMSTTNKRSAENATDLLESANTVAAQAADAVKTATAQAEGAIEASVEQIRELNEQACQGPPVSAHP